MTTKPVLLKEKATNTVPPSSERDPTILGHQHFRLFKTQKITSKLWSMLIRWKAFFSSDSNSSSNSKIIMLVPIKVFFLRKEQRSTLSTSSLWIYLRKICNSTRLTTSWSVWTIQKSLPVLRFMLIDEKCIVTFWKHCSICNILKFCNICNIGNSATFATIFNP